MSGWRAGRRFRIFARRCGYSTDYGSAPWRAVPSHPEGQRDKGKTGLPGAAIKNTGDGARLRKLGWKLSCLKSESLRSRPREGGDLYAAAYREDTDYGSHSALSSRVIHSNDGYFSRKIPNLPQVFQLIGSYLQERCRALSIPALAESSRRHNGGSAF